jgi:hypothetical protein
MTLSTLKSMNMNFQDMVDAAQPTAPARSAQQPDAAAESNDAAPAEAEGDTQES